MIYPKGMVGTTSLIPNSGPTQYMPEIDSTPAPEFGQRAPAPVAAPKGKRKVSPWAIAGMGLLGGLWANHNPQGFDAGMKNFQGGLLDSRKAEIDRQQAEEEAAWRATQAERWDADRESREEIADENREGRITLADLNNAVKVALATGMDPKTQQPMPFAPGSPYAARDNQGQNRTAGTIMDAVKMTGDTTPFQTPFMQGILGGPIQATPMGTLARTAAATNNDAARLPGIQADSRVKVETVKPRIEKPVLDNNKTKATIRNTERRTLDIGEDNARIEREARLNRELRERLQIERQTAQAQRDAARYAAQATRDAAKATEKQTAETKKKDEVLAERARKSNVPLSTWKTFENLGIAPGPQALATFDYYRKNGLFTVSDGGVWKIEPTHKSLADFRHKQDMWSQGKLKWVNGREMPVVGRGNTNPVARENNRLMDSLASRGTPAPVPAAMLNNVTRAAKSGRIPWSEIKHSNLLRGYSPQQLETLHQAYRKAGGR